MINPAKIKRKIPFYIKKCRNSKSRLHKHRFSTILLGIRNEKQPAWGCSLLFKME
jgi:hypothetical protein